MVVLIGSGGIGKTMLAKKLCKGRKRKYIAFDDFYLPRNREDYAKFLEGVAKRVNSEPEMDVVLDGYIVENDNNLDHLKGMLEHHTLRTVVLFAEPKTIMERKPSTPEHPRTESDIANFYKSLPRHMDIETAEFIDSTSGYRKTSYKEIYGSIVTREDVLGFIQRFENESNDGWDKHYQTIELPFGFSIRGYSGNTESWRRISRIFDFRGKSVVDFGCFHGYFCFEVKNAGASSVIGLDRCTKAIETAREIANINGIEADFREMDIEKDDIAGRYDVSILLNVSHHLNDPRTLLEKLFKSSRYVIVEIQFSNIAKDAVVGIARKHGHTIMNEAKSARPNREIIIFERRRHGKEGKDR